VANVKLGTDRRIASSEVAQLLGLTPQKGNACDLYARIVWGHEKTRTKAMDRGVAFEQMVRDLYVEQTGAVLMPRPSEPWICEHPEYPWATCSPDGVAIDASGRPFRLVELKTQSTWARSQWQGSAPPAYVVQVLFSLWVTGLPGAHLFPVFGTDLPGGGFSLVEAGPPLWFVRDTEMEQTFVEVCGAFWRDHVVPRIPPPGEPVNNKRRWKVELKRLNNERKAVNE
jgi:putative phage-type endonuclease